MDALREDPWRRDHPFSSDVEAAGKVMHHPFVTAEEIVRALRPWCQRYQPCNFGKQGAKFGFIHFCVLTERDLHRDDKDIRAKIDAEKKLWKRRALVNTRNPPHAFMLIATSPRLALAAPDDNLKRLSEHIRDLAGFRPTDIDPNSGNAIASDYLYLKSPHDDFYYGYRFNLDFFATAGDGRWWHDHRVPGGIAFTANSTGHMRNWQEWWGPEKGLDKGDRFLTFAMTTIEQAHATRAAAPTLRAGAASADPVEDGRVTWLIDLADHAGNKPLKDISCPFKSGVPPRLEGKDWTTYAGLLHTDHSVRAEFFDDKPPWNDRPFYMDFSYLYDHQSADFVKFMAGVRLAAQDVYRELGHEDEWAIRDGDPAARDPRPYETTEEIRRLLATCEKWTDDLEFDPPL